MRRIAMQGVVLAGAMLLAGSVLRAQPIEVLSSSVAHPLTELLAKRFAESSADPARVFPRVAGSADALRRLCAGEAAMAVVPRPILGPERLGCEAAGIAFVEAPVAFDAIVIVANPRNSTVSALSDTQLRSVWRGDGVPGPARWRDLDPAFVDAPLKLYAMEEGAEGVNSFDQAILGPGISRRRAATIVGTENILATAVARDANALGFLSFVYYEAHRARLRPLAVSSPGSGGPVAPSRETVADGRYRQLARALFLYVRVDALERPEVAAFAEFYVQSAAAQAGYIPLTADSYPFALQRVRARTAGSLWDGKVPVGLTPQALEQRLAGK